MPPSRDDQPHARFRTGQVLGVASAHLVHDTFTAFYAPLLPLLIEKLDLSLTLAGSLALLLRLPSLSQPFLGHLADRRSGKLFLVAAPAISAAMMSSLGLATGFAPLALLLLVVGFSSAAFHAPAPAMVARFSGRRVGRGMSLFMVGGEGGRTLGPLVAVQAVSLWGLDGMWRAMFLGFGASLLLLLELGRGEAGSASADAEPFRRVFGRVLPRVAPLGGIVVGRSLVTASLITFLPTLLTGRGVTLGLAAGALSVFEAAGMAGALTAGTLSDYLGRRRVLALAMLGGPILLFASLGLTGALLVLVLLLLGFLCLSMQPVLLAMVQDRCPESRGAANGVYLAMSFAGQAGAILLVGWLGDLLGLSTAMALCAGAALCCAPFLLLLHGARTR